MLLPFRGHLSRLRAFLELPTVARRERRFDRGGLPPHDPGFDRSLRAAFDWLGHAQDRSRTQDGGVARHYSLVTGWGASYPETTGYIIPTMLEGARHFEDPRLRGRAIRMLDWLTSIQFPDGGFMGGTVDAPNRVPVTFNTGQILIGLAHGAREIGGQYEPAMRRAADWLVHTQDRDGAWRKHATPFAAPGEKVYETHVAWGLFEAARTASDSRYADAGLANLRWALNYQHPNGWFDSCCLQDPARPLTHTIGYALRGILEGYRLSRDPRLLEASRTTADALLSVIDADGFIPGRLDSRWNGCVDWACLTGSAQIAACWLLLFQETGNNGYRTAAAAANKYVRRTVLAEGPVERRGGVKGAFPVHGEYGQYEYLNWACKFFIDANLLELRTADASPLGC